LKSRKKTSIKRRNEILEEESRAKGEKTSYYLRIVEKREKTHPLPILKSPGKKNKKKKTHEPLDTANVEGRKGLKGERLPGKTVPPKKKRNLRSRGEEVFRAFPEEAKEARSKKKARTVRREMGVEFRQRK